MTLNCTLVAGPGSPRVQPPVELSIDAPAGTDGKGEVNEENKKKINNN
jgi:hypothetical protein